MFQIANPYFLPAFFVSLIIHGAIGYCLAFMRSASVDLDEETLWVGFIEEASEVAAGPEKRDLQALVIDKAGVKARKATELNKQLSRQKTVTPIVPASAVARQADPGHVVSGEQAGDAATLSQAALVQPGSPVINGSGVSKLTGSYSAFVSSWLERHKRYPTRAMKRRLEGEVLLYVKLLRSGSVQNQRIEHSSGYEILDQEVLEMVQRAAPFPEAPQNLAGNAFEFVVPVRFEIS